MSSFEKAWMDKCSLVDSNFKNANLQEAKMNMVDFDGTTITGARIHYATFQDANFEGCTGCPVGW